MLRARAGMQDRRWRIEHRNQLLYVLDLPNLAMIEADSDYFEEEANSEVEEH